MNRFLKSLVFVLLLESVGFTHAQPINASQDAAPTAAASSTVQTQPLDRTLPDPKVFWSKVVRLLTEADESFTHEQLEKAVGVNVARTTGDADPGRRGYYVKLNGIGILLEEKTNEKDRELVEYSYSVSSKWSPDAFGNWRKGECLQDKFATITLFEAGWRGNRSDISHHNPIATARFRRGNKYLILHYLDYQSQGVFSPYGGTEASCIVAFYLL